MMIDLSQGDIVRLPGKKDLFVVASRNAYIRATGMLHLCVMTDHGSEGPTHVRVTGMNGTTGMVSCEQLKFIDPAAQSCSRVDRLPYRDIREISDIIQGVFEYD